MRALLILALSGCILGVGAPRLRAEGDRDEALVVINRAIRAQGGPGQLKHLHIYERRAEGKQFLGTESVAFTTTLTVAFPDRIHDEIEVQAGGGKIGIVQALDGGTAWRTAEGKTTTLGKDETADFREELYLMYISTLLPLKEEDATIKVLPDIKVDGRLTHVVQAENKDHSPIKLYFDTRTGLLIKTEHRIRQATLTVLKEFRFGDYRAFHGVRLPVKQTEYTNGSKVGELTVTGYRFLNSVDPKRFHKPG